MTFIQGHVFVNLLSTADASSGGLYILSGLVGKADCPPVILHLPSGAAGICP